MKYVGVPADIHGGTACHPVLVRYPVHCQSCHDFGYHRYASASPPFAYEHHACHSAGADVVDPGGDADPDEGDGGVTGRLRRNVRQPGSVSGAALKLPLLYVVS